MTGPRHPLILCLKLDKATQTFLTDLRTKHFPSNRNYLAAHVTLFHAIPAHRYSELDSHLHLLSASEKGWEVFVGEPKKMGTKGVMVTVRDRPHGSIERIHTDLQRWLQRGVREEKDRLTDQDARRPGKAHVTILNKAEDEQQVERCLQEVAETFEGLKQPGDKYGQQKGRAIGLEMWVLYSSAKCACGR